MSQTFFRFRFGLFLWLLGIGGLGFGYVSACSSPEPSESTAQESTDPETTTQKETTDPGESAIDSDREPSNREGGESSPETTSMDTSPDSQTSEQANKTTQVSEPKEYPIAQWKVTSIPSNASQGDQVQQALNKGTFEYPSTNGYLGHTWSDRATGKNGSLGSFVNGYTSYAATFVTMREETRAFALADTIYNVYLNGRRYLGDYYGSRQYRVPLVLQPGRNVIVVQVLPGRKAPEFQLWTTPDEIFANVHDMTTPSLRAGTTITQCVGIPILNLRTQPISDITASVVENDYVEATSVTYPTLPRSSTQIVFQLKSKKPWPAEGEKLPIQFQLSSPAMQQTYTWSIEETTVAPDTAHRRTRISTMDGSCQFDGVLPPKSYDANKKYALILSLHGAGVNALGQARSYAQKDWAFLVAPTNRRPFGFDWEAWGRLDGWEALQHAKSVYPIDPTKVYVTGHSMGGHGTWQFGVLFPGFFALVGPSAGWSSFYTYTGASRPQSIFARSQASSDTNVYLGNLAKRAVYIIHGDKDDNVPPREGRDLYAAVQKITQDAHYHEQKDVGHWWDLKDTPGTDCVDWDPMIQMMQQRTLDPSELDFSFKTPSPSVSPTHSYVTILAQISPLEDASVTSSAKDKTVTLTTQNVAAMLLDGKALQQKGIESVVVDTQTYPVTESPIAIGPQDGKRPGLHGPFNEALSQPFCYVYPDQNGEVFEHYANFLISAWNFIGNGHVGCIVSLSKLTAALRKQYNLIYVGIPSTALSSVPSPFSWDENQIKLDQSTYTNAALALVFPDQGKLSAVFFATKGSESLLYSVQPYTSRFAFPDYYVWSTRGGLGGGFFDARWKYEPKYRVGQ